MECGGGMFSEDEVIVPKCPSCDEELEWLMDSYYCYNCSMSVSKESEVSGAGSSYDDYDEPDYDSRVNNGDEICLDCTYWFVNPHGSAYGMVCRRVTSLMVLETPAVILLVISFCKLWK